MHALAVNRVPAFNNHAPHNAVPTLTATRVPHSTILLPPQSIVSCFAWRVPVPVQNRSPAAVSDTPRRLQDAPSAGGPRGPGGGRCPGPYILVLVVVVVVQVFSTILRALSLFGDRCWHRELWLVFCLFALTLPLP